MIQVYREISTISRILRASTKLDARWFASQGLFTKKLIWLWSGSLTLFDFISCSTAEVTIWLHRQLEKPISPTHFTNPISPEAKIQVVLCWCFSPKIAWHISPLKKTPQLSKSILDRWSSNCYNFLTFSYFFLTIFWQSDTDADTNTDTRHPTPDTDTNPYEMWVS